MGSWTILYSTKKNHISFRHFWAVWVKALLSISDISNALWCFAHIIISWPDRKCLPLVFRLVASVWWHGNDLTEMGAALRINPLTIQPWFILRYDSKNGLLERPLDAECHHVFPLSTVSIHPMTANRGLIGWMNVVMVHLLNLGGLQTWVPNTLAIMIR